jgi:hypothetical protein
MTLFGLICTSFLEGTHASSTGSSRLCHRISSWFSLVQLADWFHAKVEFNKTIMQFLDMFIISFVLLTLRVCVFVPQLLAALDGASQLLAALHVMGEQIVHQISTTQVSKLHATTETIIALVSPVTQPTLPIDNGASNCWLRTFQEPLARSRNSVIGRLAACGLYLA